MRGTYNLNVFREVAQCCETRVISPRPWWTRIRKPSELLAAPQAVIDGLNCSYPSYWSVPKFPTLHANAMIRSLRGPVADLRRDFPFDAILVAWMYPDGVAAARFSEKYGCPFVVKILGSDINYLPTVPGLREQIVWALGRASRVITVSEALRQKVIDLGVGPERVFVQHNGVDGERFAVRSRSEARDELGLDQGKKLICFVGNLVTEKGPDIMIQAMEYLKDREDVRLALIGDGLMRAELEKKAQELQIDGRVTFLGKLRHEQIPKWMAASDMLCLSSRREGCPNVVLEALASGRPVVAARVGGVPEILDDKSGVIVDPENPKALAEGLKAALDREWDPEKLRGSVQFLSWRQVGNFYYQSLIEALAATKETDSLLASTK